jgi:uncharacterized membrane protein
MAFCSACGASLPAGASVCPACGRSATTSAGAVHGGLTDNVAGLLAYITIIPAIIFLVVEPYNKSRFIRFHSFQCIFFWVAVMVLQISLSIIGAVPFLIFITLPLHFLLWLASVIIWIVLMIKASQGQMYKLPIIGDLAEKQANV